MGINNVHHLPMINYTMFIGFINPYIHYIYNEL